MMRHRAFTLVEIIIAIMLLGILAGTMTLSGGRAKQTAQKEAEKVAALIKSASQKADRVKVGFTLKLYNNASIDVSWDGTYKPHDLVTPLNASNGCSFEFYQQNQQKNNTISYSLKAYSGIAIINTEHISSGTPSEKIYIKVSGAGTSPYYVTISGDKFSS